MSLCYLMQSDFKHGTGRYDDRGAELYSLYDLDFGYHYASGWLEAGETSDLIGGFDLAEFRDWCALKLALDLFPDRPEHFEARAEFRKNSAARGSAVDK